MAKLTKNLAPLFDSSISYEPGERFMYGDHMYEALEPLSGAFDSTKVSEVTLADIFKGVSSNDVKCLAPEYDVNTEYSVENLVLHDGVLYECVETTTGPFDETKWSRKYLSDVGWLNSNLTNNHIPEWLVLSALAGGMKGRIYLDVSNSSTLTIGSIGAENTITFYSANVYDDSGNLLLSCTSTTSQKQEVDVSEYDTVYIEVSAILNSSGTGAYRAVSIKDIYY